jgi:hypothetical protein
MPRLAHCGLKAVFHGALPVRPPVQSPRIRPDANSPQVPVPDGRFLLDPPGSGEVAFTLLRKQWRDDFNRRHCDNA